MQGVGFIDSIEVIPDQIDMGNGLEGVVTTNGEPEIVAPVNTGVEGVVENGGATGTVVTGGGTTGGGGGGY